jgi:hypothetical protein
MHLSLAWVFAQHPVGDAFMLRSKTFGKRGGKTTSLR